MGTTWLDRTPMARVLAVHISHPARGFGAFFEDMLLADSDFKRI